MEVALGASVYERVIVPVEFRQGLNPPFYLVR
jgi:hypothetical protein